MSIDEIMIEAFTSTYSTQMLILLHLEIHKPARRVSVRPEQYTGFESGHDWLLTNLLHLSRIKEILLRV